MWGGFRPNPPAGQGPVESETARPRRLCEALGAATAPRRASGCADKSGALAYIGVRNLSTRSLNK
eukprot:8211709-Alexandrium_andersonii.AAC.1